MNYFSEEKMTVKINDSEMDCIIYHFRDIDLVKIFVECVSIKILGSVNYVFRDNCVYVNKERIEDFNEMLDDLNIEYFSFNEIKLIRSVSKNAD